MKKLLKWLPAGLVVALVLIQLVPVDRSNPPVETEIGAPQQVKALLGRACYNCHSNETVWPWYSRLAPISWLVAHDVHEGREELNFSTWNRLGPKKLDKKMREIREEVSEGEMPPWYYVWPMHPEADLTPQDQALLSDWTLSPTAGRPAADHSPAP